MLVQADKYHAMMRKRGKMYKTMGMKMPEMDMKPVDLNNAYVAFDTTQVDKESAHNLEMSHECNLKRHGLTENGV